MTRMVQTPKDEGEAIAAQRENAIASGMLPFAEERFQKTLRRILNQVTLKLDKGELTEREAWLAWAEVSSAYRLVREIKAQSAPTSIDANPLAG